MLKRKLISGILFILSITVIPIIIVSVLGDIPSYKEVRKLESRTTMVTFDEYLSGIMANEVFKDDELGVNGTTGERLTEDELFDLAIAKRTSILKAMKYKKGDAWPETVDIKLKPRLFHKSFGIYCSEDKRKEMWGDRFEEMEAAVDKAIDETKGEVYDIFE